MARNADARSGNTGRRRTTPRLSQRGCGIVALAVAGIVALALSGHAGPALLAGVALYALVTGRVAALSQIVPTAKSVLRAVAWCVVALAVAAASNGTTAAGGATLGLALAAALATYLRLSARRSR